jgi:hypothetical protein
MKNKEMDQKQLKIELLYTYDFLNTVYGKNYGFIFKGKKNFLDTKHFNLLYGVAYQYSYISEKDNSFTNYVDGYTRDIGLYSVVEVVYFPFKRKKLHLALEPFIGVTHLKSKGTLKIVQHSIFEKYKNSYTYFNYGITQSIGYKFNKLSLSGFGWGSLKGILDNGRFRPGDFDSRLFIGLGVGYTF